MRGVLRRGGATAAGVSSYKPPVPSSYTEACEAPEAFWRGAIPLRPRRVRRSDGSGWVEMGKTYSHPQERAPRALGFANINSMYCMGNDDLVKTFPEGLGGKVMQLFPPSHPRGFLYRKESHLLNTFVDKIPQFEKKASGLKVLTNGCPGFVLDGASGSGKSALLAQVTHFARSRGILTVYIPNARDWTHGEWAWPSILLPGFWDVPDATRSFLEYFARAHQDQLSSWKLRCTPKDLPIEAHEVPPATLYDLCRWGTSVPAPSSVDRQSVAVKYVLDELMANKTTPILFVVDGINLLSHETHFRYPHPDFLRTMTSWQSTTTDVDLYPQELPRIPASRLTLGRGLNQMLLSNDANKHFITCTTRDFRPYDGGVSGFADVVTDKHKSSLDEYAPFDAAKDTVLHPMKVEDFDEYEYRSFLRFLVNSGELAGFGWGPLWHYSPDFERKLDKIEFLSGRNPQRVVDHYHQEMVWRAEYGRLRLKQHLANQS